MSDEVKVVYKKKSSTGKTIVIIILIMLVCVLLGYIVYQDYQYKLNSKANEKDEQEELYYSEVEELLDKIEDYNLSLSENYPITNFDKISNQNKLYFAINYLTKYDNTINYYKVSDMKKVYKENFENDFNVIYEDIDCKNKDGALYKLNDGTYHIEEHEHDISTFKTNTYFVDGNKLVDIYKITVNILYSGYCTGICPIIGYYDNYTDMINDGAVALSKLDEYQNNKSSLKKYTFTFRKKNNDYLLRSIKIN